MSFCSELRRRKVLRVTIAYVVVMWLVIQVVVPVEEPLSLPLDNLSPEPELAELRSRLHGS